MTTEREDWKPRYSNDGNNNDGQNRERRPYQSYNRSNYGNNSGGNYGKTDNRGNYNRNYDRSGSGNYNSNNGNYNSNNGNYNRPRPNYDRSNNFDRPNRYNNTGYTPRSYDNQQGENAGGNDSAIKKRRPRVGEAGGQPQQEHYNRDNNYNRNNSYNRDNNYNRENNYNRDNNNYNRDNRSSSGGYQQRPYQSRPQQGGYNRNQNNPNFNRNGGNQDSRFAFPRQQKYREEHFDPEELIRLNKYLANAGICSRREADEFIQAGVVKVNGETVNTLGYKVKRVDQVMFHDQPIKLEHKIYVLLNKPKNCVTTADDPQERLTVMDLVKSACQERIFPVGRLDRNTTGVLLLTNDGDLASKLTHPKFLKKKIYHVWLDKNVSVDDMQKLAEGIELEDGEIHADAVSYVNEEKDQVGIEIHSGRNRIVRRMFESLGYHVMKLDRVYFAGLTKKNLKRGQWRYLSEREVAMLRAGSFE
jgi:23S rRNA pseudouridine2605 synthase